MIDYEKIAKDQRLASLPILNQLAPLLSVVAVTAWHMAGMVLLGYNQSHTCTMPRKQEIIQKCNITWTEQQSSMYIPWNSETKSLDSCTRYVYDSINCTFWGSNETQISTDDSTVPTEKCASWTYETSVFTTTVLGEFDLVCDNKQKGRLSQAIYMLGVMIGVSAWGQISDRFGRKISVILPLVIGIGVGIATAFSNSFALFVALRFFIGFTFMPSCSSSKVLGTEIVKGGRKVLLSQIFEVMFAVGIATLSGVGYFVRDWRRLQLWISAPGAIIVIWMCFTFESPRWLIAKKQFAKADKIVRKLLTQEKYYRNAEAGKLRSLCQIQSEGADGKDRMTDARLKEDEVADVPVYHNKAADNNTILDILKLPNLRKRSLIMYYIWMVISAVYYGLTLNSADLGGDVFVNLCISALVEIPAAFLAIPMMDKWGRRPTTTSMLCLSGTVCICMMFVSKEMVWLNVLLSTIGKFSISTAFGTAYVYAIEIYPTPVRNVGFGVCNSWARIGGMLAPFIAMLDVIGFAVPYVAFGLMAVLAGLLGFLLPETLRKKTPETLEEAEQFGKHDEGIMAFCCRKNNSPVTDRSTDGEWKDSPLE